MGKTLKNRFYLKFKNFWNFGHKNKKIFARLGFSQVKKKKEEGAERGLNTNFGFDFFFTFGSHLGFIFLLGLSMIEIASCRL